MFTIVIAGAGVVGQATGKGFLKKGHRVTFVDVNPATLSQLRAAGLDARTWREVDWDGADFVILSVSTPTVDGRVVLDYIEAATEEIGYGLAGVSKFVTVVVRSTVPPGTTERRIKPLLEHTSGKVAGEDLGVAMNPEFLRQAHSERDFHQPWITVLGCEDDRTAEHLRQLYAPFGSLTVRCTPTEAEMIKYVNNVFNAVKISYFNEVHAICENMGVDSAVVSAVVARSAEAMWNPLYGTRGGVPYGGACLPKDTLGFQAFARELGVDHLLLDATIAVNERLSMQVKAVPSPDQIDDARRRAPALATPTSMPEPEPELAPVPTPGANGHAAAHAYGANGKSH